LPNDVISVTPTDVHVEVNQRNLVFMKMVFPVSNGISWNGNALLPSEDPDPNYDEFNKYDWNYVYSNFDTDYQPVAKLYDHTVTVNEINDTLNNPDIDSTAYAYKNFSQEIYGYNVGMIYRERVYWVFQPKVGTSGGSGFRKGYSVIMRAVDNN
jgi:hypothetical protein